MPQQQGAAASLRCDSLTTASSSTLTHSKNTSLVLVMGSYTVLVMAGQTWATWSRHAAKRSIVSISQLYTKGTLAARPAGITEHYHSTTYVQYVVFLTFQSPLPTLPPPGSRWLRWALVQAAWATPRGGCRRRRCCCCSAPSPAVRADLSGFPRLPWTWRWCSVARPTSRRSKGGWAGKTSWTCRWTWTPSPCWWTTPTRGRCWLASVTPWRRTASTAWCSKTMSAPRLWRRSWTSFPLRHLCPSWASAEALLSSCHTRSVLMILDCWTWIKVRQCQSRLNPVCDMPRTC